MGIAKIADDSPGFSDGAPLSPTALNILRDNVLALDEASRMGGVAFAGLYGQHPEFASLTNAVIWRGGFVWVSGMTTLRITTSTTGTVLLGDTLRVYRGDDDSTYTDHTLAPGAQEFTPSIASGYIAGQAVRVRCEVRHPYAPDDSYDGCVVDIVLVEALPIALASWPGLPSFAIAGDITAAKLTQLANCLDWLIRRVARRYDPLFLDCIKRIGPFQDPDTTLSQQTVIWLGGHRRTALHTTLVVRGQTLITWNGATEVIQLRINGSVVASYSVPTTIGESSWTLSASLSGYADGAALRISVQYLRTAGGDQAGTINRWSLQEVLVSAPSGSVASLTPWTIRQASVSDSSLVSWLASLVGIAQVVYDRIAANEGLWGVQRAFTARHAFDDYQFRVFEEWCVPTSWRRTGEALIVRGKGITLGYGPGRFLEEQNEVGAFKFENFKTVTVIDADAVESAQFYLDSAPGLPAGAPYNLRGAETYVAMEQLKVVEEV